MGLSDDFKSAVKGALFSSLGENWHRSVSPTGCVPVDEAIVAGGFGEGRTGEIFGPWSSGKSLVLYRWLIENQRRGGKSFLWEAEGAFDPDWFTQQGGVFGTGTEADLLVVPDLTTVEDFFDQVSKVIAVIKKSKFKEPVAIGLDSIAAMGTKHLEKEGLSGSRDMTKAFLMDQGTKRLLSEITGTRISVVATNQTRDKVGAQKWEDTHTPGGRAWPYGASVRLELEFDGGPSGSRILDADGCAIGRMIRGQVVKNKLGPALRKFKLPIYTVAGAVHPELSGAITQVGVDGDEALLYYYLDNDHAVKTLPDGSKARFLVKKGSRIAFNPDLFEDDQSFYKKDWLSVLEANPILRTPKELRA